MDTLFGLGNYTKKNEAEKYRTDFQTRPEVCEYMVSLLPNEVRTVLEPGRVSANKHYREKIRQTLQSNFKRVRRGCYAINLN